MKQVAVSDGAERVSRDTELVKNAFDRLTGILGARLDRARILVVIAAAGRAHGHLPRSIPRLLDQIARAGFGADLILGCNSGFEPTLLLTTLAAMPDVERVDARCTKDSLGPALVLREDGSPFVLEKAEGGKHRVVVVRQAATGYSRGKVRMLSDLFGLIETSIEGGWTPPCYLLACDAESEFTALAPFLDKGADEPALARLIDRLEADATLAVVGARNRNVAFRAAAGGVLEPRPADPIPAIQLGFNLLHARAEGFLWLTGAGTLGRTLAMTAAYSTLCRFYPNTRVDDVQTALMLRVAGFRIEIEPSVAVTNYCPRADQSEEGDGQSDRWIGGIKDLEAAYGRTVVAPIATTGIGPIVRNTVRLCHRDAWGNRGIGAKVTVVRQGIRLILALRHYRRTYRQAIVQRGDDPAAIGYWPAS